ncbi:hypothetical protein [Roseimaritima sediminicola]|uniref:hypothetical protein n=1 Tax=Roseimaritima sediminicola TaxID=2662066 RepID=UPI00129850A0|nr:hypothetical protein [Roseimaritima sediminicola]
MNDALVLRRDGLLTALLAMLLLCAAVGCGRSGSLQTSYGDSHGRTGRNSINGFGALREGYHAADWDSRTIHRLGDRMLRLDAIFWTPVEASSIYASETQWFEDWLRGGDKTLIYVVYDGGSEADYWRNAARFAPPEQRFEYRRRIARAQFARDQYRHARNGIHNHGWFRTELLAAPKPLENPAGPWMPPTTTADPSPVSAAAAQAAQATPAVMSRLPQGHAQVLYRVKRKQDDSDQETPQATKPNVFRIAPAAQTSDQEEDWQAESRVRLQAMLVSDGRVPLVTRISSPAWNRSQVFVVSASGLVNNYGLSTPWGRHTAAKLIAASGSAGEIGFLVSDQHGVRITDGEADKNRKTGMELLTVWPLSLVTMHLALLGLIVCLIISPIFGRPRREVQPSQSDFADHIDAIAAMLKRQDSDRYARRRISEYLRRVRGETTGPWVQREPDPNAAAESVSRIEPPTGARGDGEARTSDPSNKPAESSDHPAPRGPNRRAP